MSNNRAVLSLLALGTLACEAPPADIEDQSSAVTKGPDYFPGDGLNLDTATRTFSVDVPRIEAIAQNVGFSGAYGDLTGKPELSVYATNALLQQDYTKTTELAPVALSGAYGALTGTPDLSVYAINALVEQDYTKTTALAAVALSGAYGDLSGRPELSVYATNALLQQDYTKTTALAPVALSGAYGALTGTPDLSVYATNAFLPWHNDSGRISARVSGAETDTPVVVTAEGRLGVGTEDPTASIDVAEGTIRLRQQPAPTQGDTCQPGEIRWDPSYIYVCVDNGAWRRSALSTF